MSREITAICFDSRRLQPGCAFVAVRGGSADGHDYLAHAARSGAAALVVESAERVPATYEGVVAIVPDARAALGTLASRFFGEPSRSLFAVGVTGTNGKTTVTHMIEAILNAIDLPCGVIGTIDHHLGGRVWPTELTTPDAVEFQRRLREFADGGARAVALEASSHALDQRRVDAVEYDCAAFTNLSRDHLDYHADMETYFAAKQRLFTSLLERSSKPRKRAVTNADDPYGARLRAAETWTYGRSSGADFRYEIGRDDFAGATFRLSSPIGDEREFRLAMPGAHNVANAVAAIAVGAAAGANLDACADALARLRGVSGRLERIDNQRGLHVFVDFAHTPSALEGALGFLKQIRARSAPDARIVAVFGCGGDRDKGKRPLMMRAALDGADSVVLTSDNPRGEDALAIMRDALEGAQAGERTRVREEVDRREAIRVAIETARAGDVILIAGKGHESHQQIGAVKKPFSDQAVAKELLA